jgi:nucleoside-diphosphate-sugar epimerase
MCTQLASRKVPVANGGTLGWIHHEDAAAATVAALEHGGGGQAYNLVDDRPATWAEVFTAMARAFGAPPPWKLPRWLFRLVAPYVATFAVDTAMRVSPAKAHAELNWRPVFPTYLDGIADMVSIGRQPAGS